MLISALKDLTIKVSKLKTFEFENSVNTVEVAHDEPPYLDLRCLLSEISLKVHVIYL